VWVEKKMKLTQLALFSFIVAILLIPMANAEIVIDNVFMQDVITTQFPNYGTFKFNILAKKPAGQDESAIILVTANGTTISTVNVVMKANEVSKSVETNATFPRATISMINPFASIPPIPDNIVYNKLQNNYLNPISSVQYEIKAGGFTKKVTLLVYADWSFWAIILDIVLMAITVIIIRRSLMT
jgi:hypothetical protein